MENSESRGQRLAIERRNQECFHKNISLNARGKSDHILFTVSLALTNEMNQSDWNDTLVFPFTGKFHVTESKNGGVLHHLHTLGPEVCIIFHFSIVQ